jgi:hypothetical protein
MPSVRSDASTKEVLFALSGDRNWLVEEALRAGSDQDGELDLAQVIRYLVDYQIRHEEPNLKDNVRRALHLIEGDAQ